MALTMTRDEIKQAENEFFLHDVLGVAPLKNPRAGAWPRIDEAALLFHLPPGAVALDQHFPPEKYPLLSKDLLINIPSDSPKVQLFTSQTEFLRDTEETLQKRFHLVPFDDYTLVRVQPGTGIINSLDTYHLLAITRDAYKRIAEDMLLEMANPEKGAQLLGMENVEAYVAALRNAELRESKLIARIVRHAEFTAGELSGLQAMAAGEMYDNSALATALGRAADLSRRAGGTEGQQTPTTNSPTR